MIEMNRWEKVRVGGESDVTPLIAMLFKPVMPQSFLTVTGCVTGWYFSLLN